MFLCDLLFTPGTLADLHTQHKTHTNFFLGYISSNHDLIYYQQTEQHNATLFKLYFIIKFESNAYDSNI